MCEQIWQCCNHAWGIHGAYPAFWGEWTLWISQSWLAIPRQDVAPELYLLSRWCGGIQVQPICMMWDACYDLCSLLLQLWELIEALLFSLVPGHLWSQRCGWWRDWLHSRVTGWLFLAHMKSFRFVLASVSILSVYVMNPKCNPNFSNVSSSKLPFCRSLKAIAGLKVTMQRSALTPSHLARWVSLMVWNFPAWRLN